MSTERKTLTINNRTFHGRMYLMWQRRYARFKVPAARESYDNLSRKIIPAYRENLCHYTRIVLIWGPLNWFFRSEMFANHNSRTTDVDTFKEFLKQLPAFLYIVIISLITSYGISWWKQPLNTLEVSALVVAIVVILMSLIFIADNWNDIQRWWRGRKAKKNHGVMPELKEPGIGHVIFQFAKAKKQKICPLIEIDQSPAENKDIYI